MTMLETDEETKVYRVKFIRHAKLLMWKSFNQRVRKWPIAAAEIVFALLMFILATLAARPVFLTSLQANPAATLTSDDIVTTLGVDTQVGYAPNTYPYDDIMKNVSAKLNNRTMLSAPSEQALNDLLYQMSTKSKTKFVKPLVIWVVWKPKEKNVWKFSIRSSELVHLVTGNKHLRSGFLAVQLAVSEALLETDAVMPLRHKIKLKSMPISPLMQKEAVRQTLVWILLCFTLAFIPPVMEVSEIAVHETTNEFKRALVMRNVGYATIYLGWLSYLHITALPILVIATLTVILIFRWVWIFVAFMFLAIYITIMAMTAFIVCLFQKQSHIAAIWSVFHTFLQLFLAYLLVLHGFDGTTSATVLLHIVLPPLGLVHGFNEFALLQTGYEGVQNQNVYENHTLIIWMVMIVVYFLILMMLQRTIGRDRAIGGQVSWRSIIFKKAEDKDKLYAIKNPEGNERDLLQEVDEHRAKAISFNNVSKSTMGATVLRNITMDVYRGEYTQFFAEKIQQRMLHKLEDLITGLTLPDEGSVNILGQDMAALSKTGKRIMAMPNMLGYCHRMSILVPGLTVQETLQFFTLLYLWDKTDEEVENYMVIHFSRLFKECDLQGVKDDYIRHLGPYYKAQVCWAIALLLEPRIVFIQTYTEGQKYVAVVNDKIVKYRSHITIVKASYSTALLEHADRVFLFDRKVLIFGGTPAYMFFRYGREYRIRMTFKARGSLDNTQVEELIDRAVDMGGQVRAYVGTLLILQLPTSPTDKTAAFIKDITDNATKYGITSFNISLPDSEEIHRRAINQSRRQIAHPESNPVVDRALREISQPKLWKRKTNRILTATLLKQTVWKYVSFYIHYRFFLIITILSACVTGTVIGLYLSFQLDEMDDLLFAKNLQSGKIMTVEALKQDTTLILKLQNTTDAIIVATCYALSHTNAKAEEIEKITYTALPHNESVTEYLMLRAIDSPQYYVFAYAYGLELNDENDVLDVHVLYSPIHHDTAAAPRALARAYTALLRLYTKKYDADIQVTDNPLTLDSSPTEKKTTVPPLIIHFMLIVTIAHITLLPTMEYGLIRHVQIHAMNFSPLRYWLSLFFCDMLLYWTLVFIITCVLMCAMYFAAPSHFLHQDLLAIPFVLIMYGFSCVPQAYIFSLGPSAALNSMSFVIFNIIFGEASVINQFLQGEAYTYAEKALSLSPQYNVANAFVRLSKIFVYNSECTIFNNKKLCKSNILHKCCKKCGVMQKCFERISYLSKQGILDEILWTIYHCLIYSTLLFIWEYRLPHRFLFFLRNRCFAPAVVPFAMAEGLGTLQERSDVTAKMHHLKQEKKDVNVKMDTFGEYLLVKDLTHKPSNRGKLNRVSLGIAKGEALSIVGISAGGDRLLLCEILAGYFYPTTGFTTSMSKWSLTTHPHNVKAPVHNGPLFARYARHVGFSCFDFSPSPPWMTVYDALWMMAVMRGIPIQYVIDEVEILIDALELDEVANVSVFRLHLNQKTRLNFAMAVIGAPPVLVLSEFTAYQSYSVDRSMFYILYNLRKQGHALLVSSPSVESHMALTNRMGIMLNGELVDVDHIDRLVARYSPEGYTVVVHLKDEVDVEEMFGKHFKAFSINDVSDVLANVQVKDNLNYSEIFAKMEELVKANPRVYSYIITVTALDYIYNDIISKNIHIKVTPPEERFWPCLRWLGRNKKKVNVEAMMQLKKFERKYDLRSLKELPWSVIFQR